MSKELKLLLLEDDSADAELIQLLLKRSGMQFSAKVVSDEGEFLKALDDNGFDAVLADNALPHYSSLEALKIIKIKNPYIAFLLVTGTVSEEFAVSIIQEGADDYILKTNLTRLSSALSKAVENKKMQREKQQAEKEMQELNEQLRNLAAHLHNVREEEQTRIAREIHDELGQMLTAIKMDISWAEKKMVGSGESKLHLSKARSLVDDTVKTVRRIASELRPSVLEDLGLIAAMEWYSQEFEKRNNIKTVFTSTIADLHVHKNAAIGLYRIYQEALTNIARHSGATKVLANMHHTESQVTLTVSDNGKGFNPEEIKSKKTLGMLGMKERALIMKGNLSTESSPGNGTTIKVIVPL